MFGLIAAVEATAKVAFVAFSQGAGMTLSIYSIFRTGRKTRTRK